MSAPLNIVLIGCGKMGGALLKGWQNQNINASFSIIDPHSPPLPGINHFSDTRSGTKALSAADIVVLAVKPQIMTEICESIKPHTPEKALILSIAAGQSLNAFARYFSPRQPVIRAMPNLPASIGKGISVAVANTAASETQKQHAHMLLESVGKIEWIEDENLLDAVTALSGSGPAYVFHLIEILTRAGTKAGLPAKTAETLARQTVIGAAALAETQNTASPATLRENVTSPGGTTEAALKILMDGRMQDVFDETLSAAATRSRELNT
ncbi:MAG: pyrroline-5-carboxylate reductase [Alphaproteobacteria bacterium]